MSTQTNTRISDYKTEFIKQGYDFRLNKCTDHIEVNGEPLSDGLAADIYCRLFDQGFKNSQVIEKVYTSLAFRNRYNPIKEYFQNLPPYDNGKYFDQLVQCFDNPDDLFKTWLKRWMLGAICKVMNGDQNMMLVLDGPQGIGKSKFVEWLCSGMPEYFVAGGIDANDKDHYIRATNKWIWEVSEMGSTMRKSDMEALKDFITRKEVTARKAYGRYETTRPAIASFIGTVNITNGLLNDPSGNRRFLVCHLKNIDWETYTNNIDVNLLWSEMMAKYYNGETGQLTDQEKQLSEANNKDYEVIDPIEEALSDYFEIDPTNRNWFLSTHDIANTMQNEAGIRFSSSKSLQMAISDTLSKIGLIKERKTINGVKNTLYFGIRKKLIIP